LELFLREGHDLSRPMTGIHQAPNRSQSIDLIHWINALAKLIPLGDWKPIASLPHTEGVLGQAGVSLDSGDAQKDGRFDRLVHVAQK
jgi:hypothetical protein